MPCTAFAYELEHVFFRLDTLVVALYRFKGFEAFQFLDFLQMSAVVLIAFEKGLAVLFQRGGQFLELVQPFFLCLQAVQRLRDVGQLGLVEPYAVLYAFQFVGIEHLFAGLLPFGFSLCDLAERPRHLFGHVCTELFGKPLSGGFFRGEVRGCSGRDVRGDSRYGRVRLLYFFRGGFSKKLHTLECF